MVALRLAVVPTDDSNAPARWITRKLRKVERFQFLEYLTRQLAWSHPSSRPVGIPGYRELDLGGDVVVLITAPVCPVYGWPIMIGGRQFFTVGYHQPRKRP